MRIAIFFAAACLAALAPEAVAQVKSPSKFIVIDPGNDIWITGRWVNQENPAAGYYFPINTVDMHCDLQLLFCQELLAEINFISHEMQPRARVHPITSIYGQTVESVRTNFPRSDVTMTLRIGMISNSATMTFTYRDPDGNGGDIQRFELE